MVRRWRIRTRVLLVPVVPALTLLVVVGFDLHRAPVTVGLAVGAAIVGLGIALLVDRSITGPVRALTRLAADRRAFVERAASAPPADDLIGARDVRAGGELADLAIAIADGRRAAVDLLGDQRRDRRNLADVVGTVALRNELLLASALESLDGVARRDLDPAATAAVARVHRLVARVDRATAAEVVLLGRLSHVVRSPASLTDTVWAAALAIESSDRVDALAFPALEISAAAVGDVAHLVAELLDNAIRFSAPDGRVTMLGEVTDSGGFDLSIVDAGPGLASSDLAAANRRIRRVDPLDRLSAEGLGLDVVGRLARRHDIDVQLGTATTGGVAALVRLPGAILTPCAETAEPSPPALHVVVLPIEPEAAGATSADPVSDLGDAPTTEPVIDLLDAPTTDAAIDLVADADTPPPMRPATDDLLPRRQPKWAAAIAMRSQS